MKSHRKRERLLFQVSAISFLIASATVFLTAAIPDAGGEYSLFSNLTGILFWLGMLLGVLCFCLIWIRIKKDKHYIRLKKSTRPGAVSFAATRAGMAADCLTAVFFVLLPIGFFLKLPDAVTMFFFFIFLYSFCLHFLLNGRVCRYLYAHEKEVETI